MALSPEDDPGKYQTTSNDCHQDQEFLDCYVGHFLLEVVFIQGSSNWWWHCLLLHNKVAGWIPFVSASTLGNLKSYFIVYSLLVMSSKGVQSCKLLWQHHDTAKLPLLTPSCQMEHRSQQCIIPSCQMEHRRTLGIGTHTIMPDGIQEPIQENFASHHLLTLLFNSWGTLLVSARRNFLRTSPPTEKTSQILWGCQVSR